MALVPEEKEMLEDLFDTYYDRVYAFLFSRLGNASQAEDLASGTFLKVAENFRSYDSRKGALSTWIFSIALNELRGMLRQNRRHVLVALDELFGAPPYDEPEKKAERRQEQNEVFSALSRLNERQRAIVTLKYYGSLSNREIGAILAISETNVSTILSRSTQKLKSMLEESKLFMDSAYVEQEET